VSPDYDQLREMALSGEARTKTAAERAYGNDSVSIDTWLITESLQGLTECLTALTLAVISANDKADNPNQEKAKAHE
jgi:hypothetical protein